MNSANSLLILSAGRGIGLDGFHKLNLVAPSTGETILARYLRQLSDDVTVVVGYRAPEMMAQHPSLNYVYNHSWFETGSAFSAGMGLSTAPVIVAPSDLFLDETAAKGVSTAAGNVIFASSTENRPQNSVNIELDGDTAADLYTGPKRHGDDPEFKGIVRIEDLDLLEALAKTCEANPAAAFSDCLNLHREAFRVVVLDGEVTEINAVAEYVEFFNRDRERADP